jgi:hypothetical protein
MDRGSILKGQDIPICDFCGRKGHTEPACLIKNKAMASARKDTKDRNAQWKKEKAEKSTILCCISFINSKRG